NTSTYLFELFRELEICAAPPRRDHRPRLQHQRLRRGNIFARMPERARHPDELVEKFVDPAGVRRIGDSAASRIEKFSCCTEIYVRENCDQAELAQHRQQTLDHARATKRSC